MRYCSLGSGSRGNATLIEYQRTRLLVDCGFSLRATEQRLALAGLSPRQLTAILVTHEHSDHIKGVERLAQRYGLPVYMTAGTRQALGDSELPVQLIRFGEDFVIGDIQVTPVPVPHDAREPCQFIFDSGSHRLGVLTDTGTITPLIVEMYSGLDALFLEANYDPQMLASGPYPPFLRARVGGSLGHLSNQQAAGLLEAIDISTLRHVAIAHISEKNNRPELALGELSRVLDGWSGELRLAVQNQGLPWQDIAGLTAQPQFACIGSR
ncbi:MBL fold metallo-hydrolase [Halopseudomonas xiamenensis]|uniref:MBL fold metallo-hydrolase n=1 Tax=Halopseudomonas xiamenensis TaxID=157792 RepID=UPI001625C59F|nr:MBL fold metallo-hydrolase [Halopseudomonas xiamenensis]